MYLYIYIWVSILGNMHLVTIYMERRLRRRTVTVMENVVKHKSSRYSGRIDFNTCPSSVLKYCFQSSKKGQLGHFENICQFLSQKHAYKFRSKKLQKPRNRKSQRAKSMNVKYIPSICITLTLFHNIFFFRNRLLQEDDFTSEHLLLLEKSLGEISFFFHSINILQQRTYPFTGSTC